MSSSQKSVNKAKTVSPSIAPLTTSDITGSTDLMQEAVNREEAFQGTLQVSRAWKVVCESVPLPLRGQTVFTVVPFRPLLKAIFALPWANFFGIFLSCQASCPPPLLAEEQRAGT